MELLVYVCKRILSALVHQRTDCLVGILRLVHKIVVVVAQGALFFVFEEHLDHLLALGQDAACVLYLICHDRIVQSFRRIAS